MAESRTESGKYITATTLTVPGYALKLGTNYKEIALATAATDVPIGVTSEPADNSGTQNISYLTPGQTVNC